MATELIIGENGRKLGDVEITPGGPQPAARHSSADARTLSFLNSGQRSLVPDKAETGGSVSGAVSAVGEGIVAGAAGIVAGLVEDPIIRYAVESLFGEDADDEILKRAGELMDDSTVGAVGRFVGEMAPYLTGGMALFRGGAKLAVKAAGVAGEKKLLGKGAENILARNTLGETREAITHRLSGTVPMEKLVAASEAEYATQLSARAAMVGIGGVERVAQAVGGSVGFGTFEGIEALADGAEFNDAVRAAATSAALALAFEGTFAAAGMATSAAKGKIVKAELAELKPVLGKQNKAIRKQHKKLQGLATAVRELNHTAEQEIALTTKAVVKAKAARAGVTPMEEAYSLESANRFAAQEVKAAKLETQAERLVAERRRAKDKGINKRNEAFQELRNRRALAENTRQAIENPLDYLSTRKNPFNPSDLGLWWRTSLMKFIRTPEALIGKLGGVARQMQFKPIQEADQAIVLANGFFEQELHKWLERSRRNMGFTAKQVKKDPNLFGELGHAWETQGEGGVRELMLGLGRTEQQVQNQIAVFRMAKLRMREIAKGLEDLGAKPIMSAEDLQTRGLFEYMPHEVIANAPDSKLLKAFSRYSDEAKAQEWINDLRAPGLAKQGSFDYARIRNGSLLDKVKDPHLAEVYESNIFKAMETYFKRGTYRLEYAKRFGLNGEMTEQIVAAVRKDAGQNAGALSRAIFDQVFNRSYVNAYGQHLSKLLVSEQIFTKLGMAVWANMFQPANNAAMFNVRKSFKGMKLLLDKETKTDIQRGIGVLDALQVTLQSSHGRFASGATTELAGSKLGKIADASEALAGQMLAFTRFTSREQANRMYAGAAGKYVFRDNIVQLAEGRLRGNNFDVAFRQMDSMGVYANEVRDLVGRYAGEGVALFDDKLVKGLENKAIYRAAQITQFTPGVLRRPGWWSHPAGRVVFQFKTFALNHSRFMTDQVLGEFAAGNVRPLATILSIYPIAGELVEDLKSGVKMERREETGIERVVYNYFAMGGLGLATDLYRSAQWGAFKETVMGPGIGDLADLGEGLLQADVSAFIREQSRNPTARTAKALLLGTAAVAGSAVQAGTNILDRTEAFDLFRSQPRDTTDD